MPLIHHLRLRNFRNYEFLDVDFSPGMTLLIGPNGQGKTNLLESIYFLSLLRSFRTHRIRDLMRWESSAFFIAGALLEKTGRISERLAVLWKNNARRLRVNGVEVRKGSEFIRRFHVIAFSPEDILLVKGAASERRRFFDVLLSQMDAEYLHHLQNYVRLLKTRNTVIKNLDKYGSAALRAFESPMAIAGAAVIEKRREVTSLLKNRLSNIWKDMNGKESGSIEIGYKSSMPASRGGSGKERSELESALLEAWEKDLDRDQLRGATAIGPHRDDFALSLEGYSLGEYGSEGQCRLAAICLRLAAAEVLSVLCGGADDLIMLVDDVLGELDEKRRNGFLRRIMDAGQIFWACTELPEPIIVNAPMNIWSVCNGKLMRK